MAMAAGAAVLRSVATKMARAPPRLQYALEDHGRRLPTSSGSTRFSTSTGGSMPPSANLRQGTADALVSAGMAAATGLRSGAGRLTTKMPHAPPPPYHRLVQGRGVHSGASPDPSPSTQKKVLFLSAALDYATTAAFAVGCAALLGSTFYMHFWIKPAVKELNATLEDLRKKRISRNMAASSVSHPTPRQPQDKVRTTEHL